MAIPLVTLAEAALVAFPGEPTLAVFLVGGALAVAGTDDSPARLAASEHRENCARFNKAPLLEAQRLHLLRTSASARPREAKLSECMRSASTGINRIFVQFRDSEQNESLVFSTAVEYQEDSDGDLLGDSWERRYFGDLSRSGREDSDGDGLSNHTEFLAKSNPANSDTDGDGLPDGWEYKYGFNLQVNDADADADHDGLSNRAEYISGTDPLDPKSQLAIRVNHEIAGELTVSWPTEIGRLYSIYVLSSLTEGEWRKLPNFSNQPGTGRSMSYTHRISEKGEFLKLGVQIDR